MAKSTKKSKRKKKGGRLNKRLLMIVSLTVMIVAVLVAGLIFLRMKGSVSRNLHAGNTHVEDGKWEQAQRAYGRVVKKDPANQEGMDGLMHVYNNWVPKTREHANQLQVAYAQTILHDTEYHPDDNARAIRAMEFLHDEARAMNFDAHWEALQRLTDTVRAKFPDDSEAGQRALYFRALTRLALETESFTRDRDDKGNVIFPGEEELTEYLALRPGDDDGMAQLAFGRMAVARRLGLDEQFQQEKRNLALAEETFRQALAANPNGPATLLAYVRHLILHELTTESRQARQIGTLTTQERDAVLAELTVNLELVEDLLREDPEVNPFLLADFFQFVRIGDEERGNERIRDLARHYLESHPEDDLRRLELAEALRNLEAFDDAMTEVRAVLHAEDRSVAHGAARQHLVRAMAAKKLLDIAARKWSLAEAGDGVREEAITAAEEARDALVAQLQGDETGPLVIEADGRLAFMRGDHREAARLLEQLVRGGGVTTEILRINAVALDSIGQPGQAAERLRQAVKINPVSTSSRVMLAGVLGRMRQPEEALQVLQPIPQGILDENPQIVGLRQSLQAMRMADRGGDIESLGNPVLEAIMRADALQREGRIEEAAAEVRAVVDGVPDGPDILPALVAAAQLESSLDRRDEAVALIARARSIRPDDERLEQIALALVIEDPIERLRAYVEQRETDPVRRDVSLLLSLEGLALAQELQAGRLDRMGETGASEAARQLAERAREAAAPLREAVADVDQPDAQLFLVQFQDKLREGRLDEAEAMLSAGRDQNVDQAGGNLLEAELLLARFEAARAADDPSADDMGKRAVNAARRATQEADWNAGTWRQLGRILQETGDIEEARLAWAEAWRRNPTEPSTVRVYAQILLQPGGDPGQAAKVLRDAAREDRTDRTLVEDWLSVEAAHGDRGVALVERDRIYTSNPGDRTNALRLAGMLATLEPTFDLMVEAGDQASLSPRQWLAMSGEDQQEMLDALRARWRAKAAEICDGLAASDDVHLQHALMHATVLSQLGRRADMLQRLARFVDRTDDDPDRDQINEVLSAAQFLIESDRQWEAAEFLRARTVLQGDDRRLDGALGTVLASIKRPADAVPLLRAAVDAGSTNLQPRLIEVLLQLHRIDDAKARLAAVVEAAPDDYQTAMLQALVARADQAVAEAQGDASKAAAAQADYRSLLEEASQRDPQQLAPYLELITSMIREYRSTIDRSVLESALRYADAAAEIRSDVPALAIQRAMVLEALGEPRRAANDLESFLRRNPSAEAARVSLARMHVAAGTPERARTVLEEAIITGRNPSAWRERLAEHLIRHQNDRVGATELLARAWQDEPTDSRLDRLCNLTRTHEPWAHEAIYRAVESRPELLADNPEARGLKARSESAQGLRDHARETLREAWTAYRRAAASGSMPPDKLARWFEDVYVVFRGRDADGADSFILQVVGPDDDPKLLAGRAHFLTLRGNDGDLDHAISLLKKALESLSGEDRLTPLSHLGSVQLKAQRDADAVATFTEIVELDQDNPVALNNLAWLIATLQDDPQKALPLVRRAIELDSMEPSFLDTMTEVQSRRGDHEAAMTSRLSRLRLQPNNPALLKEIAEAYLEHYSDPGQARPYAERVLQLSPRDASALDLAGWIDFKSGKTARAEDRLKQSIRRAPSAQAHLHLARILADQGRVGPALDQLRQAEALSSSDDMRARIKTLRDDLEATG